MTATEKIELICPKCSLKNEVLWFKEEGFTAKVSGSTGRPSNKFFGKPERVQGACVCGYIFKPKDLDEC